MREITLERSRSRRRSAVARRSGDVEDVVPRLERRVERLGNGQEPSEQSTAEHLLDALLELAKLEHRIAHEPDAAIRQE